MGRFILLSMLILQITACAKKSDSGDDSDEEVDVDWEGEWTNPDPVVAMTLPKTFIFDKGANGPLYLVAGENDEVLVFDPETLESTRHALKGSAACLDSIITETKAYFVCPDVIDGYDPSSGAWASVSGTALPDGSKIKIAYADGQVLGRYSPGSRWTSARQRGMRVESHAVIVEGALLAIETALKYPDEDNIDENTPQINVQPLRLDLATGEWTSLEARTMTAYIDTVVFDRSAFLGDGILDVDSGKWTDAPQVDRLIAANVNVGRKTVFAAGGIDYFRNIFEGSDEVDIFDNDKKEWQHKKLSAARVLGEPAVKGDVAVFPNGVSETDYRYGVNYAVNAFDLYNAATDTWTSGKLTNSGMPLKTLVDGDKAYFFSFTDNTNSKIGADVYDFTTDGWSKTSTTEEMQQPTAEPEYSFVQAGSLVAVVKLPDIALFNLETGDVRALLAKGKGQATAFFHDNKLFIAAEDEDPQTLQIFDFETKAWVGE
jgi:hypothetical protein